MGLAYFETRTNVAPHVDLERRNFSFSFLGFCFGIRFQGGLG